MNDCELVEINLGPSELTSNLRSDDIIEEYIDAGFGSILVARHGKILRPNSSQHCIITFHDLGLNYLSNFQSFFNHRLMQPVVDRMPVYHINAPGQEDNAEDLPHDYSYPTIDQIAESVQTVCNYYGIKQAICFGVGLGANVLARVALKNPDLVDGLFMINPVPTPAGWVEWAYQKRNIYYLNNMDDGLSQSGSGDLYDKFAFPQCVLDYLIWHHFGESADVRSLDLLCMYKSYFSSLKVRPRNLALLIDSYLKRDDIGVTRSQPSQIKCSSLILCGNDSPYLEDSINMNQRLQHDLSTWMKLFDCGLPLDEQPHKVAEAFILFIQGLGLGLLTCYKYKDFLRKNQ